MKVVALLVVSFMFAQSAVACPMCASGGPADFGRYDEPMERYGDKEETKKVVVPVRKMKRWSIGLDARTVRASEGPNDADEHRQSQLGLMAAYRPSSQLFLTARVPYSRMSLSESGESIATNSGFGDSEFLATYEFRLKNTRWRPALTLGTKIPTGDNDLRMITGGNVFRAYDAERLDEHGQLGTGAWDGMVMAHVRRGGVYRLSSTLGYRVNGDNDFGYRYGTVAWFDVAVARSLYENFSASLSSRLRHAGRNSEDGHEEFHSGGTMFLLTPEIGYSLANSLNLSAQCTLPVVNGLNGEQSESLGLTVALTQTF